MNFTADERLKEADKSTYTGMAVNILLTALKFIAGILGASAAMIADAIHSLSDLITDFVVLAGVRLGGKPADRNHPYGHGKIETFASLIIAVVLLIVAFGIMFEGVKSIHAVLQGKILPRPGAIALIVAFISIASKEILYRYTISVGKRIENMVVISNAWHHRSDAMSSVATLLGVGGAYFLGEKWRLLDPLAAVIVSFFIIAIAVKIFKDAFDEMIEHSLSPEVIQTIKNACLSVPEVSEPHNIKTRRIGPRIAVELHIRLPKDISFEAAHDITTRAEHCIKARLGRDTFVMIHSEPAK